MLKIYIEWSQKNNKDLVFDIITHKGGKNNKQFKAEITVDGESISQGYGFSKKKAEQDAARRACEHLNIED